MALDLIDWCVRHHEALFITFLVIMGVKLAAGVAGAIDQGVQKYRARTSKP